MSDEETFESAVYFEGVPEAIKKVAAWLEKFHDSPENEGGAEIEIYHFVGGGMSDEEPFETVEYDLRLSPDQLARKVVNKAVEYCDDFDSGKVRFQVRIEGAKGKIVFPITVPDRETDDELDEAPNARGQAMQQMRHNEKLVNVVVKSMDKTMQMFESAATMYKTMLQDRDNRVKELESQHLTTIKTYEELNSQAHLRALEFRKLEKQEKRMDQVAGILMQGAPHLFNKLLGGAGAPRDKVVSEDWTPLENILLGFANTIDADQLNKLVSAGIFRQDQIMGFMELMTALKEKHDAQEAAAKAKSEAANGHANGQSNGASNHATGQG